MTDTALEAEFGTLSALLAIHAAEQPSKVAVIDGDLRLTYSELDALVDQVAAAMQRDGVSKGDVVAICSAASARYIATFLGGLRSGAIVAPLSPSSSPEAFVAQLSDSGAIFLFADKAVVQLMAAAIDGFDGSLVSFEHEHPTKGFESWLTPAGSTPLPVQIEPADGFNLIYSSGTTGMPKGIIQPHAMRWAQLRRVTYPADAVTLLSTPLYSNTTLVSLFPALSVGGTIVLLPKFDAGTFLSLSERHRVTHAMLVPIQYRRILAHQDFDRRDLKSYHMKFCTSAPFSANLKSEILRKWPGGLVEFYGMTEGGGTCALHAHLHPEKLDTVGQPLPGHDIRIVDENGRELPFGEKGEIVGRSASMMTGYHNRPAQTAEAEWYAPDGSRFIRTGDIGQFDAAGFLTLVGRRKEMIISGGFNIYPSDLECELLQHHAVLEASVIGVPSVEWGETPVAFVILNPGNDVGAEDLRQWLNARVGRTQRLTELRLVAEFPRSPIGKILKRDLLNLYRLAHDGH